MKLYPETTRFFINGWTWGYEAVYEAIARSFQSQVGTHCLVSKPWLTYHVQIHVDRYKHGIYSRLKGAPFLRTIVTRDEKSTRFHACERFNRCDHVNVKGRNSHTDYGAHVVYINPVTMGALSWQSYVSETSKLLRGGQEVNNLVRP